jgi:uncharacterized protein YxjI
MVYAEYQQGRRDALLTSGETPECSASSAPSRPSPQRLSLRALLLTAAACSTNEMSTAQFGQNPDKVQAVISKLNSAKTITMKKAAFSMGDSWTIKADDKEVATIKADDKEVATIKGEAFKVWGDTYSMYTTDGTFVGAEQEQIHILSGRQAETYDYQGHKAGSINAQRFSLLYQFNITDTTGAQVGKFKQGFGFNLKGDITDKAGQKEWSANRAMFSMGANITLTSQTADKDVSALNAIWTVAIVNEVAEAADNSSSKSGK